MVSTRFAGHFCCAALSAPAWVFSWSGASHREGLWCWRGAVRQIEKTLFRSRPKAVIAACDGRLVKVYLLGRRWDLTEGDRLRLYVADNTPVYEQDGVLVLGGYLAGERRN